MAAGETALLLRFLFTVTGTASTSLVGTGEPLRLPERKLRGERLLIVFDNVDPRKKQVVEAIMPTLRRGRRGSKIIVTSNDVKHVAGLGTVEPITLRPLPPAEYWFFFKAHAFGGADPRLVAAGQSISQRLRGSFFGWKIVG